jgi:hypothetical protein
MKHRIIDMLILGTSLAAAYNYFVSNSFPSLMLALGCFAFYIFIIFGLGRASFWRLIAKQPELAIKLLEKESGVFFNEKPRNVDVTGPFKLFSNGYSYTFFIRKDEMEQIQKRIFDSLNEKK